MNSETRAAAQQRAVGILAKRSDTEQALQSLKDQGFPMEQVSVIAQDEKLKEGLNQVDPEIDVQPQVTSGSEKGAVAGGTVGAISGLLVGLGAIAIPGLGPVMLAGATATALATTLASGVVGATTGGLVGALIGLGVPEKEAATYNDYVAKGYYILLVEGTASEVQKAKDILSQRGIEEWQVFFALGASNVVE
ncbi:hypothetical protein C1752_07460 [Acaryochloris thomasi RCC1774]|uniref:General stress protein 17M-like domain-containing protein n=1 Tax=Acaryochloris thomasi RCC1774 TaxID=1764569 RepID=A0A2W1JM08_9CYAN|nr:DUF1269 domain-containing protein [Acaryochloris thomasi]PZD71184.1 hypothetical protein C1752_07460 [Acaryochloris thomasi RCC1774]